MKISTLLGVMLMAGAMVPAAQAQSRSEDFINPPPPVPRSSAGPVDAPAADKSGFDEPVRPAGRGANELVYRNGSWFVVRSVRDGGKTVTCTGTARPLTAAEREAGAVSIAGSDFAQLVKRSRLKIDVATNDGAKTRHELDLNGLAGVVKNIEAGCPGRR
jgi:hypothetical protein